MIEPGGSTQVITPTDGQQLAAALHAASTARQATIISGGGTKIGWGRTPERIDLVIGTSKLRGVTHRYGDLTATVGAGVTLAEVNRELAIHGQWLPLDGAFDDATIGGLVATNDSGPLRHRFGTPRDRLLGVTLAMTDGRLVKAGGTVVKNVAGYDLGRLVSGSFGTLAAIETATFKLAPLPAASASLRVRYTDRGAFCRAAEVVAQSSLELTALDFRAAFAVGVAPVCDLSLRVASSPAATEAQLAAAKTMTDEGAEPIRGAQETALWREQVRAPWEGAGATVRLAWRPADLARVLSLLEDVHRRLDAPLVLTGRIGAGAGALRVDALPPAQVATVDALRSSPLVGHVLVLRAEPAVKAAIDVWGPMSNSVQVMQAIKRKLDPAGILNAGRGPI
jgi:glycolate oxidase FAD binding subunit